MNVVSRALAMALIVFVLASCSTTNAPPAGSGETDGADGAISTDQAAAPSDLATERADTEVKLLLDWVPNTNHTGIFVAEALGYFADEGLRVEIIQPGEVMAQQAVASGAAEFGIDFQEQMTMAVADDRPLVSVAAIVQHNTSGFAAPTGLGVTSPRDWAGKRYGSFGSPFESPTLRVMMACDEGDFDQLEIVNTGFADPLALMAEGQTDLAWIFYAWQGLQAEHNDLSLDVIMMDEWFDCVPDYYTPVLITSTEMIEQQPQTVSAFVRAVSRGYEYSILNPEAAADVLLEAVPELDRELVLASQVWLAPRYRDDADRWGEQDRQVWSDYAQWMLDNGIIDEPIDVDAAFTNSFLP